MRTTGNPLQPLWLDRTNNKLPVPEKFWKAVVKKNTSGGWDKVLAIVGTNDPRKYTACIRIPKC